MKIAVEGCAHGELEKIYDTISLIEKKENVKVDLLICCGDFQSTRNEEDLACMACPPKYRDMCSFYKYYSGEKQAPVLTLFIGGNHEASSYLQELAYGGWVAPNIFYLGYAGVVNIGGLRIGGISGIHKGHDYLKGHYEKGPYTEQTKRSCYHIRNLEVFRLNQLSGKVDIMCSHDWPQGVYHFGNTAQLLKHKPYFKQEMEDNQLGSPACQEVLNRLKPTYWFSAHLHTKFSAVVPHQDGSRTKFLALDKCLPKRRFLQILDLEHSASEPLQLKYDHEWLAVLFLTNHLLSVKSSYNYMPGPNTSNERYSFTPSQQELDLVANKFDNNFIVPQNFTPTAPAYNPNNRSSNRNKQASSKIHPITRAFCETLCIDDPLALLVAQCKEQSPQNSGHRSETDSFNDSYCSFQSSNPSALSTPCTESELSVTSGSIRKFKMNLPSPRNNSDTFDQTNESDSSCVVLDSTIEKALSVEEETRMMASVKKFKPYKSKISTNADTPVKIESPLASELPKPMFDSPLSNGTLCQPVLNSSLEDSPISALTQPLSHRGELLSTTVSKHLFDSPVEDSPKLTSDSSECLPVLEQSSECVKPVAKKFKRRNQSIYQTQEDE